MSEDDSQRRLAAKRNNERVKLVSNALNAIAITVIGAAVVLPAISSPSLLLTNQPWLLLFFAFALHLGAHMTIGILRSED